MHMADALLSPAVGGAFYIASGAALAVSARKLAHEGNDRQVPLMGVLGAFVFASQMINFTIPGTGSSGHLVGGVLLIILLGPFAAFITVASVLIVQALFFADGGIMALGANIWNMGFYGTFIGWPLYRAIAGSSPRRASISIAAGIIPVITLELGAMSVALETVLSGRSELPIGKFALLMAGIHLPIGLIEGLITVAVINVVYRVRPELVTQSLSKASLPEGAEERRLKPRVSYRSVIAGIAVSALLIAGLLSWFASSLPDGLEWTIGRVYGQEELPAQKNGIASALAKIQEATSFMPDYNFKAAAEKEEKNGPDKNSPVSLGTSVSGIVGSAIVLLIVGLLSFVLVRWRGKRQPQRS